jgi:hypothetical protein
MFVLRTRFKKRRIAKRFLGSSIGKWEVWKHINLAIFEDHPINRVIVCNKILQDLGEVTRFKLTKVSRIERQPFLGGDWPVGFFDGVYCILLLKKKFQS